jgi:hypothetical protein
MKKPALPVLILPVLVILAIIFASGCINTAETPDPIIGTWTSENDDRYVLILNADGTGTDSYVRGNTTLFCPVAWEYDGESYLLDYPNTAALSVDGKTLTLDYGTVFSGDGISGTWTGQETYLIYPGITGSEYYYIFDNHTGIYYWKCNENPAFSSVNGLSWKQLDNGTFSFYNYTQGYIFELSENDTVQTFFDGGIHYTGNGLIGVWNRTEPNITPDGSIYTARRIMNADGTSTLTWYDQNGTVSIGYDQIWTKLGGYYVIVGPESSRLGELILNDDGSISYYHPQDHETVYHKQ